LKITPVDIKNQKFGKSLRGYDSSEVDSFLEMAASTLEELILENHYLKEKLQSSESSLGGYKELEGNLKEVLLTAQKSSEELKKNAEKEAQLIMREAKLRSERGLEETHHLLFNMKKDISDLKNLKQESILRLKSMLETQMKLLESMEAQDQSYKDDLKIVQIHGSSNPESDKLI